MNLPVAVSVISALVLSQKWIRYDELLTETAGIVDGPLAFKILAPLVSIIGTLVITKVETEIKKGDLDWVYAEMSKVAPKAYPLLSERQQNSQRDNAVAIAAAELEEDTDRWERQWGYFVLAAGFALGIFALLLDANISVYVAVFVMGGLALLLVAFYVRQLPQAIERLRLGALLKTGQKMGWDPTVWQ